MLSVIVLEDGAFRRCLDYEDGALMNGISVLQKRLQGDPQNLLPGKDTENPHPTMLVPWSQTSSLQNSDQQISVVHKIPSLWYFVITAETD